MRKFVIIAGGLGNQLFQIASALSTTDEVVHVVTCIGNPRRHAGKLEVASLDFQGRVQFTKCKKRHYLSQLQLAPDPHLRTCYQYWISLAQAHLETLEPVEGKNPLERSTALEFRESFAMAACWP